MEHPIPDVYCELQWMEQLIYQTKVVGRGPKNKTHFTHCKVALIGGKKQTRISFIHLLGFEEQILEILETPVSFIWYNY